MSIVHCLTLFYIVLHSFTSFGNRNICNTKKLHFHPIICIIFPSVSWAVQQSLRTIFSSKESNLHIAMYIHVQCACMLELFRDTIFVLYGQYSDSIKPCTCIGVELSLGWWIEIKFSFQVTKADTRIKRICTIFNPQESRTYRNCIPCTC